jgi:hypothetical protein
LDLLYLKKNGSDIRALLQLIALSCKYLRKYFALQQVGAVSATAGGKKKPIAFNRG